MTFSSNKFEKIVLKKCKLVSQSGNLEIQRLFCEKEDFAVHGCRKKVVMATSMLKCTLRRLDDNGSLYTRA